MADSKLPFHRQQQHHSSNSSSKEEQHLSNDGGIGEASSGLQFVLLRQRVAQEMDKAGYSTVLVLLDVGLSLLSVLLYVIMTYGLLVQVRLCLHTAAAAAAAAGVRCSSRKGSAAVGRSCWMWTVTVKCVAVLHHDVWTAGAGG
jgi:hypothetical protein